MLQHQTRVILSAILITACGSSSGVTNPDGPDIPSVNGNLVEAMRLSGDLPVGVITDGQLCIEVDGSPHCLMVVPIGIGEHPCIAPPYDSDGVMWSFDNGSVALHLTEQPTLWIWDSERSCPVTRRWPEPEYSQEPTEFNLEIFANSDGTEFSGPLPSIVDLDLLDSLPGNEQLQLGEHGFRILSADGSGLVELVIEGFDDVTEGTEAYTDWDDPTVMSSTAQLIITPLADNSFELGFIQHSDTEYGDHYGDSDRAYVFDWETDAGLVLRSSWESTGARGWSIDTDAVQSGWVERQLFETTLGSLVFEHGEEVRDSNRDCMSSDYLYQDDEEAIREAETDPCCYRSASSETSYVGWTFSSTDGTTIELGEIYREEIEEIEPEECQ